jgi:hypothetical protein
LQTSSLKQQIKKQVPITKGLPEGQRLASRSQLLKGIDFIAAFATNKINLRDYAADILFFFYHLATTTDDPMIKNKALSRGRKVASHWRELQSVPKEITRLFHTLVAEQAATDLGIKDRSFRLRLHGKISLELIIEFLGFDPVNQAPPENLTDQCQLCKIQNRPGRVYCVSCRKKLTKLSRYDVWLNAIVITHHLHKNMLLGGELLTHVLKWIEQMRPYPTEPIKLQAEAWEASYAITHIIYAITNYSHRQISKHGLQVEYRYLENACQQAMANNDMDLLGECVDGLRSFKQSKQPVWLSNVQQYILLQQNQDGSWGNMDDPPHRRMHTTWTSIDAIRSYAWAEPTTSFTKFIS